MPDPPKRSYLRRNIVPASMNPDPVDLVSSEQVPLVSRYLFPIGIIGKGSDHLDLMAALTQVLAQPRVEGSDAGELGRVIDSPNDYSHWARSDD
jgi:hypothetical protein